MTQTLARFDEIEQFAQQMEAYTQGASTEESFAAARLQMGIYGQRQSGAYMIRVKVPGGRLSRVQLQTLQHGLAHHSDNPFLSITTRQDIQFHFVSLDHVVPLLNTLAQAGLTTREACGNTVRNVTACALAGVCPHERTNVHDYLEPAVQHLLRHPLTQHLPRKFKIGFSGCEQDCAQGRMHDLAFVATQLDGKPGFRVLAGGGLGHKPHEAIELETWLAPEKLLACVEAVIHVHQKYSDRKKRAQSRIKFLVDRFGEAGFRDKYREEFARVERVVDDVTGIGSWRTPDTDTGYPIFPLRAPVRQKQTDIYVAPLHIPLGDLTHARLQSIIDIMQQFNLTEIRTGQDQNLLLPNVKRPQLDALLAALHEQGLRSKDTADSVVACPGTWTCRLGITSSRDAANVLSGEGDALNLNVSGCHNGCAQPALADIGFHGLAKRHFGKLVPYYQLHLGGQDAHAGFGLKGPEIPAAYIRDAVQRVKRAFHTDRKNGEAFSAWARRKGVPFFTGLLEDFTLVRPDDLAYLLKDHGENDEFRVVPLGGGECAGVSSETVAAFLAEAQNEAVYRNTFLNQNMVREALECCASGLRLVARALLFKQGTKTSDNLHQIANQLALQSKGNVKLVARFHQLQAEYERECKATTAERVRKLGHEIDVWTTSVTELINDARGFAPIGRTVLEGNSVLDLRQESAPMAYLRVRAAVKQLSANEPLIVCLNDEEAARLVGEGLSKTGVCVIERDASGKGHEITLRVTTAQDKNVESVV